jgi:hypothetical protein
MKKLLIPAMVALTVALPTIAPAAGGSPNAAQMQKLQWVLGSWDCTWKAGPDSGVVKLSFEEVMNGAWIREIETRPSSKGEFRATAMHYTGYDPAEKKWRHLGPNADGTYDVAESPDAITWSDPAGTVLTVKHDSENEFTESMTFQSQGQTVDYVQSCKRP